MITNAIPGITNINTLVKNTPAKGIAASKEQTADFYKALTDANSQKQTANVTSSVAKTLTSTGAVYESRNTAATYEKTQNVTKTDNTGNTAETKNTNTVAAENNNTASTDKAAATDNKNATETAKDTNAVVNETAEAPEKVTEQTEEQAVVAEALFQIFDNPEGEANAIEITDEALTALEQAMLDDSRALMQQLSETLGVDIEELENAMATLGLTNVAILDPTNITQIIGEITNAEDVMAIVTNADLYLNVQNMQDAVDTTRQNLMEEFNLTEEGLSSALQNFSEDLAKQETQNQIPIETSENPITVENPVIIETPTANVPTEAVRLDITGDETVEGIVKEIIPQEQPVTTITETPETVTRAATEITVDTEADTVTEPKTDVPDFQLQAEAPVQEQVTERQTNRDTGNNDNRNNNTHENTEGSVYNQVMNQISSSLTEVVETESYGQMARANTQEIMDQITEFIKMNVKADSTTMEMQLHPASLGNVNVIIEAAKDGNVVAKFLTQNEDVRVAIESQLQQLQERFNEQGVKVTAVEVTVNAGAFDQTLNDSQSQKEDDQDAQNSIRKPMRRIRLDDLSAEALGEIDEEDQLTAEMMAINGNTVDFSA